MWKRDMSRGEVADLIERFLEARPSYPQEWNDFVETPQQEGDIESYRKRLNELDPLVNCPGDQDPKAVAELRSILHKLRSGTA